MTDPGEATEQRLAANLKSSRERAELSQREVAEAMRDRGFTWHQQTVARVESAGQSVRAAELKEIADILGTSIDALMRPPELEIAGALMLSTARKVRESRRQIADLTLRHEADAARLRAMLEQARENGTAERLRNEIRAAMSALGDAGQRDGPDSGGAGRGPVDDAT